jgi:hypothetical protein
LGQRPVGPAGQHLIDLRENVGVNAKSTPRSNGLLAKPLQDHLKGVLVEDPVGDAAVEAQATASQFVVPKQRADVVPGDELPVLAMGIAPVVELDKWFILVVG